MDADTLTRILAATPWYFQWAMAFGMVALADICWGKYIQAVNSKRANLSGAWSVALLVMGGIAVLCYTASPILLIPAAVGAYVGTWLAVEKD